MNMSECESVTLLLPLSGSVEPLLTLCQKTVLWLGARYFAVDSAASADDDSDAAGSCLLQLPLLCWATLLKWAKAECHFWLFSPTVVKCSASASASASLA